jgi:hypothetical protein
MKLETVDGGWWIVDSGEPAESGRAADGLGRGGGRASSGFVGPYRNKSTGVRPRGGWGCCQANGRSSFVKPGQTIKLSLPRFSGLCDERARRARGSEPGWQATPHLSQTPVRPKITIYPTESDQIRPFNFLRPKKRCINPIKNQAQHHDAPHVFCSIKHALSRAFIVLASWKQGLKL